MRGRNFTPVRHALIEALWEAPKPAPRAASTAKSRDDLILQSMSKREIHAAHVRFLLDKGWTCSKIIRAGHASAGVVYGVASGDHWPNLVALRPDWFED